MKKTFVSMGLAAAGTAAFHFNCAAQVLSTEAPKLWNVSASLNGFYDDNYATAPDGSKKGSYGVEFSPTITANIPFKQTDFGVLYTYDVQYFEERDHINQPPVDQSHTFDLWLDHSFNEEWQAKLNDSFVSGQEPELLNSAEPNNSPKRLEGNNIANNASISLDTQWTRLFSTSLTYGNNFYDYQDSGGKVESLDGGLPNVYTGGIQTASYAGELNRDQNSVGLDLQWHLAPETMVFVGYQFEIVNYTSDEPIGVYNDFEVINGGLYDFPRTYTSSTRDNLSHFGYVGLQHNLLPNMVIAGKAGVQYDDAYNNPDQSVTGFSPYVNASLIYTYLPGCNAQLGFTESRNSTDVALVSSTGSLTQDQSSSSLHASVNHRLTQKLLVSVIGAWTESTFNGGPNNNQSDTDYGAGLSINYAFTRNFSGNINYNYDQISSDIDGRAYDRNRISIGVSLAY